METVRQCMLTWHQITIIADWCLAGGVNNYMIPAMVVDNE